MCIKVIHLCWADGKGGAFIGARRLHEVFLTDPRFSSHLLVLHKTTGSDNVSVIRRSSLIKKLYSIVSKFLRKSVKSQNNITRSFNIIPTGAAKHINELQPDIVQFHWIGNDTISLWEIPKIRAPIVWKLPDMWAFSGCAHYTLPGHENHFSDYKLIEKGLPYDQGVNFEKIFVAIKKFAFRKANLNFVGPSSWLTRLVQESYLFRHRPARHIINPIDTSVWKSNPSRVLRRAFGISDDDFVILFSSMNALSDPRKGFHHLTKILSQLSSLIAKRSIKCAVIGHAGETFYISDIPCIPLGVTFDEVRLASLYNIGDVFAFPSEMDNLANSLKEATCCGLPCVTFDVGGNHDMITQSLNGDLVVPFNTNDFAMALLKYYKMPRKELRVIRKKISSDARKLHSPTEAANNYYSFYTNILKAK